MIDKVEPASGQDKPKHAGGRPRKLTDDEQYEVYKAYEQYIADNDDPTIAGFVSGNEIAVQYNVTDSNINDWSEFSSLRKRATKKQEHYLLTYGGKGTYNPTIAIFRLKQPQHGYTDKIQNENTGEQKLIIETRKHKTNTDDGDGNPDD